MELMLGQGRLPLTNHYTPEVSHSTWKMEGSFSGPNFWAVRQTNSSSIWAVQEALNCRYQKKTAPRNQCFFCTIIPKHTSSGECRNAVAFLNIFKVWHDLPRKNLVSLRWYFLRIPPWYANVCHHLGRICLEHLFTDQSTYPHVRYPHEKQSLNKGLLTIGP